MKMTLIVIGNHEIDYEEKQLKFENRQLRRTMAPIRQCTLQHLYQLFFSNLEAFIETYLRKVHFSL